MKTTLTLLLATVVCAGATVDLLPSQGGDQRGKGQSKGAPGPLKQGKGKPGAADVVGGPGGDGEADAEHDIANQAVGPAGLEGRIGPLRGDNFFTALASVRPRRLAPGESGTLHVVVTLRPGWVVLPTAHMKLVVDPKDCPLILGQPSHKPARVARFAKLFEGQRVYDDSIEFEVPVTVGKSAETQKHYLKGTVEIDMTDAKTGKPGGRIVGSLVGYAKIGASLPKPKIDRVKRGRGAAKTAESGPGTTAKAGIEPKSPTIAGKTETGTGTGQTTKTLETTGPGTADLSGPDAGELVVDSTDGNVLLLILGGLGMLVMIVLLVLRGRR